MFYEGKEVGVQVLGGAFGVFDSENDKTRSTYSFAVNPYIQKRLRYFYEVSLGGELFLNWSKPGIDDNLRMMLSPNFRINLNFRLFGTLSLDIDMAGGPSWWPKNKNTSHLASTFNEHRFGWNARGTLGVHFLMSRKSSFHIGAGYMWLGSTNNGNSWIKHRTPILMVGPRFYL